MPRCQKCGRDIPLVGGVRGGFVIVEGRDREGHIITIPYEWRCVEHAPPGHSDFSGQKAMILFAQVAAGYEKRLRYPPPIWKLPNGQATTFVAGVSRLNESEAAKLTRDYELLGEGHIVAVVEHDLPVEEIAVDLSS